MFRMRTFITSVLALGAIVVLLLAFDEGSMILGFVGFALLIIAASFSGPKHSAEHPAPAARPDSPPPGEDLIAKENNRKVAIEVASAGGMMGAWASNWLKAYDRDPSVPIYGVRPYWTPTGLGGSPEVLSIVAFHGLEARLRYARELEDGDIFLEIMANDPHPSVRDLARARLN